MELYKISFTLYLLGLAMIPSSQSQNSKQDYLDVHNAARAAVGVGPMTWDDKVEAFAHNYTNQRKEDCKLVHSSGPYGENLAKGGDDRLTGKIAVDMWVGEKPNYDYNSSTCVGGECGHYMQVVCRRSVRLGCARVICKSGPSFVSCNYDPQGIMGERPY